MEGTVIRALSPDSSPRGCVLRGEGQGDGRTLYGHFSVSNRWTEIDSWREGHFLEMVAPGAFTRTFAEDRAAMRVIFSHGFDYELGDKPIARIQTLREDSVGAYYEAPLLDGVPELVVAGLRAGQYGASFRFQVTRETFDERPARSDYNPEGIAERVILEARVREFGPTTYPAYKDATAGLRAAQRQFDDWAHLSDEWAAA